MTTGSPTRRVTLANGDSGQRRGSEILREGETREYGRGAEVNPLPAHVDFLVRVGDGRAERST